MKCSAKVWQNHGRYQCSRNSAVERDGLPYCRQHDPDAVKARHAARDRKYQAASRVSSAKYRARDLHDKIAEAAIAGMPTAALVTEYNEAKAVEYAAREALAKLNKGGKA